MSLLLRHRPHETVTCREVVRSLQLVLDGETDELTRRRVARHLAACRRCGMEAEVYRELKRLLRAEPAPRTDALQRLRDFMERLAHT